MFDPRVVHASQATGLPTRRSDGSYTASTHSDGLSDRQNIHGRVDIAVMVSPAPWTGPLTDAQGERVQQMPTGGTGFATREPAVDLDDRLRFGYNQSDRRANRGVRQGTGKAVVLNHAPEMQVFDVDRIEPICQHRAEFVQAVLARIGNLLMQAGDTAALLSAPVRALLFPEQPALGAGEQDGLSAQVPRVRDRLAVREGGEAAHTEVNADRQAGLHPFHGLNFNDHRYIVAPGRVPRDGDGARINLHASTDTQRQDSELGQCQPLRGEVKPEGTFGVFSTISHTPFLLERGVGAPLREEIHEGGLQMAEGLLQWNAGHIIQKCHLWIAFQGRQFLVTTRIGQSFATLEGQRSRGQHAVVDQTATAKRLRQVAGLFRGGVGAKCPTAFHGSIYQVKSNP